MSSVSLSDASRVYGKFAPSDTIEGLILGIVKGRAKYGPPVDKVYSYRTEGGKVNLLYCERPGEEGGLERNPHVSDVHLVYSGGKVLDLPDYLVEAAG